MFGREQEGITLDVADKGRGLFSSEVRWSVSLLLYEWAIHSLGSARKTTSSGIACSYFAMRIRIRSGSCLALFSGPLCRALCALVCPALGYDAGRCVFTGRVFNEPSVWPSARPTTLRSPQERGLSSCRLPILQVALRPASCPLHPTIHPTTGRGIVSLETA